MAAAMLEKIWGMQTENDSAVEISAPYTGICKEEYSLKELWNNLPTFFTSHGPSAGVMCQVLGITFQERCRLAKENPEENGE